MKHPVYFYCMLAVCCVFVGSKFLTRASEQGQGGYPILKTPAQEEAEEFKRVLKESEITAKQDEERRAKLSQELGTPKQETQTASASERATSHTDYDPTNAGARALGLPGSGAQPTAYPTSHAQPTPTPTPTPTQPQYEYFENPPKRKDLPSAPTTQANTPAYPQTSAQQYPTSHAQATAQPTQAAAQAATAAQPYFWQYYWQMVAAKATALQNYLAGQLAALRTRFGL